MLEVLAFCNLERAKPPSIMITVLTFLVKKKSSLVLVVVLVLEHKGLYFYLNPFTLIRGNAKKFTKKSRNHSVMSYKINSTIQKFL